MTTADLTDTVAALDRDAAGGAAAPAPSAVVVRCSMMRARSPSLWPLAADETVAPVRVLGGCSCGQDTLSGDVTQLLDTHDIDTVIVHGHTDCAAVETAYDHAVGEQTDVPAGLDCRLEPLLELAVDAVDSGRLTADMARSPALARLAEANVVDQVRTFANHLDPSVTVAGYVHDETGVYGPIPDGHYLVAVNERTDVQAIRAQVPEDTDSAVMTLL